MTVIAARAIRLLSIGLLLDLSRPGWSVWSLSRSGRPESFARPGPGFRGDRTWPGRAGGVALDRPRMLAPSRGRTGQTRTRRAQRCDSAGVAPSEMRAGRGLRRNDDADASDRHGTGRRLGGPDRLP